MHSTIKDDKSSSVAIFGLNGHQICRSPFIHHRMKIVAAGACQREELPDDLPGREEIPIYDTLDELLKDDRIELVSLCSPRRADQAHHAITCLENGKHVYAEKPCATTEEDLDAIIETARRTGRKFHEMAGTAFEQPYLAMREIVLAGTIGDVVQILAQKSYPYKDTRPQDEGIDGGLICQNGVHALRFIEQVGCRKISSISAIETSYGNPKGGGLMMASAMNMRLEGGGIATAIANYLNSNEFGTWGNEALRIFGTKGFVEAVNGGRDTHLYLADRDLGPIDAGAPSYNWFGGVLDDIEGLGSLPVSLEDELHPTRMVIRAKASAAPRVNHH